MSITGRKFAVFTMDVESFNDTECVSRSGTGVNVDMLDGIDEYVGLLERYGIRSTMFAVYRTVKAVMDKLSHFAQNGHDIGLHGYSHTAPLLQNDERFRLETAAAREKLECALGRQVNGYRAPCFSLDNSKLEILRELGFRYDSSRLDFPRARHSGSIDTNGFSETLNGVFREDGFYEFGLVCQRILGGNFPISGGGYVRLCNWGVVRAAIEQYVRANNYYVFYLHPFELSRERIPRIGSLKLYDKYYLRAGLTTYRFKIEAIIKLLARFSSVR